MFDSAPSNLPVEPGAAPVQKPAAAAPAPSPEPPAPVFPPSEPAPRPAPRPLSTASLKKEPEDIFSGLDTGGPAPTGSEPMHMEPEHHRSPVGVIALALVIILLVGGAGAAVWYFVLREKPVVVPSTPTTTTSPVVTANSEPIVETPPSLPPEPQGTTTPPPNIPPPQSITTSTPPTPEPTVTRTEAADTDGDGVSDPEEAVIGTDATMPDSDGDGFTDGSELQNGYDPAAAKVAITASPRYHDVAIGSTLGVYLPSAWTASVDPSLPGEFRIQTGTPTSFTVQVASRPSGSTFADWLASNDPTADPSAMRSLTTKAGFQAHMTFDRLHSYIEIPGSIVVITYVPGASTSYDFRTLYDMIVQTIRIR